METVLITGGTGLIGKALTAELTAQGNKVIILTRKIRSSKKPGSLVQYAEWNLKEQTIDVGALQQADYIIHLAGANIAGGRWTASRKKELVESRTQTAALLVGALKEIPNKVKAVVSASAIGWYGPDPQIPNPHPFEETALANDSFLGQTCRQWEESIEGVTALGKRLVKLRMGIVLSADGGAYVEFRKPMQFGAATILGTGKQIVSWIHINDAVGAFLFALKNEKLQGAYNAVAPQTITNKELIMAIAKAKHGVAITARVPEWLLKTVLGEMSIEVLKSATVSGRKLQAAGYEFRFPSIESATLNLQQNAS